MANLDAYKLEDGKLSAYAWPGGYPIFYLVADGGILCPTCANDNLALTTDQDDKQWHIVAADCNWEDPAMFCDHCGKRVESAYTEDDAAE